MGMRRAYDTKFSRAKIGDWLGISILRYQIFQGLLDKCSTIARFVDDTGVILEGWEIGYGVPTTIRRCGRHRSYLNLFAFHFGHALKMACLAEKYLCSFLRLLSIQKRFLYIF